VELPITCVEGWSATGRWTGVRVSELVAVVGGAAGAAVSVESLQRGSPYRTSILDPGHAADPLTLIALRLNGEVLHPDHGYPARLIAPNRPGVMQTKWVTAVLVAGP
jgi:DMSO/TMAO reductase YedYZ molybdopterin-dependent catalytic subunit